jgi:DNA-binding transcriptional LysR family regulator
MVVDPLVENPERTGRGDANSVDPGAFQAASVELRHLRYFLALADELHFGRAAARLYITQPGLSQAVARLEQVLEVALFTRNHHRVELTEAGVELVHRARRLLAAHNEAIDVIRGIGRGEVATIRLGLGLFDEPIVAPAVKTFQHAHPQIFLDHCAMFSRRLLDALVAGTVDLVIVGQVPDLDSPVAIEWEPLRRTRLAVIAGRATRFAGMTAVTIAELENETLFANPRAIAPGEHEWLRLICREYGGFDPWLLEAPSLASFVPGADGCPLESGKGVAVVPEATSRQAEPFGYVVVPIEPPPHYTVGMAWRRGEQPPQVERLIGSLRSFREEHGWLS